MSKKIIVIGAGFSGMAAATLLASKGFKVKLIEKNSIPGGRARNYSENGFLFDLGPSWYWLPDVFESYFNRFGKSVSDYYDLVRLDPSYKVFYSKEEYYNVPTGSENVAALFESIEKGSGNKLKKFLKEAEFKYNLGINNLVYKPAKSIFEYINWEVISGVFKLHVFTSWHKYVLKNFKDARLYPLLAFPIIFLGATPKRTPALYNLMNYADMELGTWYPMGGMFSVVEGFRKLAEEKGVEFIYDSPVDKIITNNNKIAGVEANGKFYEADYIVGSGDYHHIDTKLLPKEYRQYSDKYWDSREMAPSSLLFYIGVNKRLERLEHHNLMFDEEFEQHANDIFETPKWPEKPLLYVSCTSKTDPVAAPEGQENLVILIPVAPGIHDTDETREKLFGLAISRLEKLTDQSIREHIIYKRTYAHRDFAQDYNAFKGNAYGLGNTLMQTAILKPRIQHKKLKNLFFAGQLTTPGPGVPPTIISGLVSATEILKSEGIK
jgi:phytoene desaturase